MSRIRHILHLTDAHIRDHEDHGARSVRNALIKDLRGIRENLSPEFAVFTGDLSFSGHEAEYAGSLDTLLEILDAAGMSEKQLVIVPGNHDACQNEIERRLPDLHSFRERARKPDEANALLHSSEFQSYVKSVFKNYIDVSDTFNCHSVLYSDILCSGYLVNGTYVLSLNSASLTSGGLRSIPPDRGQLFVAEESVGSAIDACPANTPILAIGHHPWTWLNEVHEGLISRQVEKNCLAYLCGHLHEARPKSVSSSLGSTLLAQSGALYSRRDCWNGYAVISFSPDLRHQRVTFRRWWEDRLEFSHAEDLANNGVFYPSETSADFWRENSLSLAGAELRRWKKDTLLPSLREQFGQTMSDHEIESIFVEPEFEREAPYTREGEARIGSKIETWEFSDMLRDSRNCLISAAHESGKSTLLQMWAMRLCQDANEYASESIPVYISFGGIKKYKNSIEQQVRRFLTQIPSNIKAKKLLDEGFITLLVDDVEFKMTDRRDALIEFVEAFPKCRYIFASSTPLVETAALEPEISKQVPFLIFKLRSLRNRSLLSLIENHGIKDPLRADQMLQRVVREASTLNVPLTVVTGTFFIQILGKGNSETPVHHAAFIERYIELLLEKFSDKEILPGTFNFRNKVDLLSVIAEQMSREESYAPEENELLKTVVSYLRGYGLNFSAAKILQHFIDARILERDGESVRFKLRMFYEYFVALRMFNDPNFQGWVFGAERYLSFANEISFYAALAQRDKARLDQIFRSFVELDTQVWAGSPASVRDGSFLEKYEVPNHEFSILEIEGLSLRDSRETGRNEYLDAGDYLPTNESQEVVRVHHKAESDKWLAHLVILSGMLKHTEFIPDWDKRRILRGVLDGWLRFAALSLSIVKTLAEDRRIVFNGVTYRANFPENLEASEVARRISLAMPAAVGQMAAIFVGAEKLQLQLEEGIGDENELPARQFLRFVILSELMLDNLVDSAAKVAGRIKDSQFLKHVLARKLYDIGVRYRISEAQARRLDNLVGDLYAQLGGSYTDKSGKRKSRVIQGMHRQRLLMKLTKKDK